MSRKRSLKKQEKAQASGLALLAAALEAGDLAALERLLPALRRTGPPSPPVHLAEAVLDLAAGRCEAARSRLAALRADPEALPAGLLTALDDLASRPRELPGEAAVWNLFQALQGDDEESWRRGVQALRAAAAELELARSSGVRGLIECADRHLALLAGLATLDGPSHEIAGWLRGPGSELAAVLTAGGPPLFGPLRHAVRTRWRAVLERVEEREGSQGLAVLASARPGLLVQDVDLPGSAQEALRQRESAREHLAAGRHGDLAGLLRARGRTVSAGDLAVLWSLELHARRQSADEEETEREEEWRSGAAESAFHRMLRRLEEMAGEIGRRIPADQCAEVARLLREELFGLCEDLRFCSHTAGAALSLLDHLPGDLGLLIAGVAGAVAESDRGALRRLAARAAAQAGRVISERERSVADRLLAQVAMEAPFTIAESLRLLRPLFTGRDWPEIAALVARGMIGTFAAGLGEETLVSAVEGSALELSALRKNLDLLRPLIGETAGFAAMELGLAIWPADRRTRKRRTESFLAAVPGLEGPLAALELVERAALLSAPQQGATVSPLLAHAAIERLDRRWPLWCPVAPILAVIADPAHEQLLEEKIRLLLADPEVRGEARERIGQALRAVENVGQMKKPLRRKRQTVKTAKKAKRPQGSQEEKPRPAPSDSPQLDLRFPR